MVLKNPSIHLSEKELVTKIMIRLIRLTEKIIELFVDLRPLGLSKTILY